MKARKGIAILGSTGSIGKQTLEVLDAFPDLFDLQVLSANSNADKLIGQAKKYQPNCVVICDESKYSIVKEALADEDIKVFAGESSLVQVVENSEIDIVLTALVGYAGLAPTLAAIRAGKIIALANKETLVVAGELVTAEAKKYNARIIPVDSEHSAIFQCLTGEDGRSLEKIILTASGGPFRGYSAEQLAAVTKQQALKHPNWEMGAKITIDSASLMNKGLEVIEAKWLFDLRPDQIDVVVHPQSIVHSLVQFSDGSLKAQMGLPDMRLPIQYALSWPERWHNDFARFSFLDYPQLTFEEPDRKTFLNLDLAFRAMEKGGIAACALNAANEVAVQAFLEEKISFLQIAEINRQIMDGADSIAKPQLSDYVAADEASRRKAAELIHT